MDTKKNTTTSKNTHTQTDAGTGAHDHVDTAGGAFADSLTTVTGTVTSAPATTLARLVEVVVVDDSGREWLVRARRGELGRDVRPGAVVTVEGAEGWVVPGRSWRHEPSRTILQASRVTTRQLALAA